MKNLSLYSAINDGEVIQLDKEMVDSHEFTPLSDLQTETLGFVEVYEDHLFTENVQGFTITKIKQAKRKEVKAETLEREFQRRLRRASEAGTSFDMDALLEEVNQDLTRTSEWTEKEFLVFIDTINNRILIDAPRNQAEDCMGLLHNVLVNPVEFEVVMTDAAIMQKLLTSYVLKPNLIPEPMVLGDEVHLGSPAQAGKKAPSSNISIKKENVSGEEVLKHLANNKRVNKVELDFDGIIYFKIDNTFFISGISFEQDLDYKEDSDLTDSVNFISEYTLKLPEINKVIDTLLKEVGNVSL